MLPFPHSQNTLLKSLCTLGIGGPARYVSACKTICEMQERLTYCHLHSLPFLILGKGSNCLFDDRGFDGLVILNQIDTLRREGNLFWAGGGYGFARFGSQTARLGFTGLEFAAGIPASVGGAIYMNAGANGRQTADALVEVAFVHETGKLERIPKDTLTFGYRTSSFQKMRGAVVEGLFALTPSTRAKSTQKELLGYRLESQPYGDKSAGCAFRNPSNASAGKLIEECGLKGRACGGAAVSLKHANFIVNQGGATAADVRALLDEIKEKVWAQKRVRLEEEIQIIAYE